MYNAIDDGSATAMSQSLVYNGQSMGMQSMTNQAMNANLNTNQSVISPN